MNEDFVSYELAVKLKAVGFNWPCTTFYRNLDHELMEGGEMNWNNGVDYSAPSLWQAQKWLREKKGFEVNAIWSFEESAWFAYSSPMNRPQIMCTDVSDTSYPTYEQALTEGIKSALELIKKGE